MFRQNPNIEIPNSKFTGLRLARIRISNDKMTHSPVVAEATLAKSATKSLEVRLFWFIRYLRTYFNRNYFLQYKVMPRFPSESWGLLRVTDGRAPCFPDLSVGEAPAPSPPRGMGRGQVSPTDKSVKTAARESCPPQLGGLGIEEKTS